MMTELLAHGNDRVVRAMSGALRNLAIDARNRDLLGEGQGVHLNLISDEVITGSLTGLGSE